MSPTVRTIFVVFLLAVALYCAYGVLSTFEPGISLGWRISYISVGAAAVIGAVRLCLSSAHEAE